MLKTAHTGWLSQRGNCAAIGFAVSVALNLFLIGFLVSHLTQHGPVVRVEMSDSQSIARPIATLKTETNREYDAITTNTERFLRSQVPAQATLSVDTPPTVARTSTVSSSSSSDSSWSVKWSGVGDLPLDPGLALAPRDLTKLQRFYERIAKLPEHREVIDAVVAIEKRNVAAGVPKQPIHVLDVGLNLGAVSSGILHACSTCIVYGFEPIPDYYQFSKAHLEKGFPGRVKVFNYAVCDEQGKKTIHVDSFDRGNDVNVGWNTLIGHKKTSSQVDLTITCLPLDAMYTHILKPAGWNRIDFIKVDVEGAEYLVIRGGHQFFASHPAPKPRIHVEIGWANQRDDWKEEVSEFEYLFTVGYKPFNYRTLSGTQNLFIEPQ